MPHTRKIDATHEVTIRSDRARRGGWVSEGDIYISSQGTGVGASVEGTGRTMSSAERRAFEAARRWCADRP